MTTRVKKYLFDAHSAAGLIPEFLKEKTLNDLMTDVFLCSAVERQFEIPGEALNYAWREKEDLELDILDLPKIVGLRNRIIHGYDTVNTEVLWKLAQKEIPLLRQRLTELLD